MRTNHLATVTLIALVSLFAGCVAEVGEAEEDVAEVDSLAYDNEQTDPADLENLERMIEGDPTANTWSCNWAYPQLGSWQAITKACRDYNSKSGQRFWSVTAPRWTAVKYRILVNGSVVRTRSICADCNTVGYTTGSTRVQVWNPANSTWLNGASI